MRFLSNKIEILQVLQQTLQEYPSFCSAYMFLYVLFNENLIVLHHGDNTLLLDFDICIKLNSNLNNEEMIMSP